MVKLLTLAATSCSMFYTGVSKKHLALVNAHRRPEGCLSVSVGNKRGALFYAGYAPGADQEVNLKYIFKLDTPNLGTNTGQCTIYNKSSLKRLTLLVVKTTESNGSPVKWDRVLYGPKIDMT